MRESRQEGGAGERLENVGGGVVLFPSSYYCPPACLRAFLLSSCVSCGVSSRRLVLACRPAACVVVLFLLAVLVVLSSCRPVVLRLACCVVVLRVASRRLVVRFVVCLSWCWEID